MLFSRFRPGGRNDPTPLSQVDFIPGHQTGLTASGGCQNQEFKTPDSRWIRFACADRLNGLPDFFMGNGLEMALEVVGFGERHRDRLHGIVGAIALRHGPSQHRPQDAA